MQVTAMHWRDDPILLGSPPMKPPPLPLWPAAARRGDLVGSGLSFERVAELDWGTALIVADEGRDCGRCACA
jgi:hypothetical protein